MRVEKGVDGRAGLEATVLMLRDGKKILNALVEFFFFFYKLYIAWY